MDSTTELTNERLEVLHILETYDGEMLSVSKMADARDKGKEATRRLLKRMHDDGLVNYQSSYSGSKISLTSTGLKEIQNTPYPRGNVGGSVGGEDLKRLHGFVCEARIMSETPSDWVGVMQEKEDVSVLKNGDTQSIIAKDVWCIRFHKDNLTFQLRDGCSISGKTSAEVFREAHASVKDVGAWVERAADISIQLKRFKILNSELGFEGHPIAELAGELPRVPLDRFSVVHDDVQKQVLTIDGSPEWTEELEAQSEKTEAIAQGIENEMEQIARPEVLEKRHSVENEMLVQDVSGQQMVHGARQGLEASESIERIQDVLEEQQKTRNSIIELVRSNQNVIHELKEEGGESSDVVEETIRDVLEDNAFSTPGLQYGHLMAWKNGECIKLLDKSVVERSDSDLIKLVDKWKV